MIQDYVVRQNVSLVFACLFISHCINIWGENGLKKPMCFSHIWSWLKCAISSLLSLNRAALPGVLRGVWVTIGGLWWKRPTPCWTEPQTHAALYMYVQEPPLPLSNVSLCAHQALAHTRCRTHTAVLALSVRATVLKVLYCCVLQMWGNIQFPECSLHHHHSQDKSKQVLGVGNLY